MVDVEALHILGLVLVGGSCGDQWLATWEGCWAIKSLGQLYCQIPEYTIYYTALLPDTRMHCTLYV